jgi:hypothetical protein
MIVWWLWWLIYLSPILTLAVVGWYTLETKWLRKTAQQQIEVSQQQLKAIQEQIETTQRPFMVIDPTWNDNSLRKFKVRNIGNSAAVNVELIYGRYKLMIPIIDSKEWVDVGVIEDSDALRELHDLLGLPEEWLKFTLNAESISKGVIMKIEYCNVAMMQYYTNEKILPEKVIIESSGKMGLYNPSA